MNHNLIPNFSWTLPTGPNNLVGNIYRGLIVDSNGDADLVTSATTSIVVGFQQVDVTGVNQQVSIESNGIVLAECGAAVTAGAEVSIMADGKIEDQNASNTTVGNALATGATGEIVSIKLKNM